MATPSAYSQDGAFTPNEFSEGTLPTEAELIADGNMPAPEVLLTEEPVNDTPATPMEITADGEVAYDQLTGLATAKRNVVIKYKGATLFADEVSYDKNSGTATATGNTYLYSQGKEWHGDVLIYNFNTREVTATKFDGIMGNDYSDTTKDRFNNAVLLYKGDEIKTSPEGSYDVFNATLSASDYEKPDTRMEAKSIQIYPDDYVVMRNVTFYVGDVPVFYLPYYKQSISDRRMPFFVRPGYSTKLGAMMTVGYNWTLNQYVEGNLYVSGYSKRGIGGGSDFSIKFGKNKEYGEGVYRAFAVEDKRANESFAGTGRSDVPDLRYRFSAKQRNYLDKDRNLTFTANVNVWSDPYVTEDFFENEFRKEVQPDNALDLTYYNPEFTAGVMTRLKLNNFFETVERLPEAFFNLKRQRIFGTRLMYQTETTFSYLKRAFANQSQNFNALVPTQQNFFPPDYEAGRIDTYHQLTYPILVAGWLNLTPRVGVRGTYYSDTPTPGSPTFASSGKDAMRGVLNTGMEASFKLHKTWSNVQNEKWEIDGIRHMIIPSANYAYIPTPNYRPGDLYQFDYLLPSTKLPPIDFPQYNSVDAIDKLNVVRLGIRNKIQTQRGDYKTSKIKRNWDLVDWHLYVDANITSTNPNWNEGQFSDIFNEITLRPTRWWTTMVDFRNDSSDGNLNEFNTSTSFQVAGNFDAFFNTRYLGRSQFFPTGNQFGPGFKYRINEDWSVGGYWLYEADQKFLQYQEYSISRDWPSWVTSFTFRQVRNQNGPDDNQFLLIFTLKAFPAINVNTSINPSTSGTQ
ncbi:hypothetical protein QPK87_07690 [Kamptonema cortianum]|nr:hypothetical protein [Kamptonema cortianum]